MSSCWSSSRPSRPDGPSASRAVSARFCTAASEILSSVAISPYVRPWRSTSWRTAFWSAGRSSKRAMRRRRLTERPPVSCRSLMDLSLPYVPEGGFDGLYGLVIDTIDLDAGEVRAHVAVRDHHLQPAGLVHGGVLASIAESITSLATWYAVQADGKSAQGLSNQTSFLRPLLGGTIHAVARARHRGRTTWVWEVEISDDEQRLCSLVR